MKYSLNFDLLITQLGLGKLIYPPKQILGGLLHRMYKVTTDQGQYAVKVLNPEIMQRSRAFNNFIVSEKIARTAKKNGFPAITAINVNGNVIHNIEGQYYLMFPWWDGIPITPQSITSFHCEIIGKMLAHLHTIDFSSLDVANDLTNTIHDIDWGKYADQAEEKQLEWADLLKNNINNLCKWSEWVNSWSSYIAEKMVISHRDFDSKNIIWNQNQAYVIDWESAGFINPLLELIETACNWAGYNELNMDKEKFLSVIKSYVTSKNISENINWQAILESNFLGKIEWLEYNIRRSVQLKCTDNEEQILGTQETVKTITRVVYYAEMIPTLIKWLTQDYYKI